MFRLEEELVSKFLFHINNSLFDLNITGYSNEFNYISGRTDVIAACDGETLIAFEAKLINLKKVINQAYRNTSFADYSYVVLPENKKTAALKMLPEFIERNIGLVLVNDERSWIEIKASENIPLLPWIRARADKKIVAEGEVVNGEMSIC